MRIKNIALLAAIFSLSFAAQAGAMDASAPEAQALMKGYFGNTRICRIDGLFECHMWLNADGTYVLFAYNAVNEAGGGAFNDTRGGFHVDRGHWSIQGTKGAYKLCRITEDAKDQTHKPTCGLPEPERPDLNGPDGQKVGDTFWKYHETGGLKGTTEHYYMLKGHV